jgi:FSR family fosmidomycin resistance protein-like MFS transporter
VRRRPSEGGGRIGYPSPLDRPRHHTQREDLLPTQTAELSGAAAPPPREPSAAGATSVQEATAWSSLAVLACGHFAVDCCTGIWPVFKTLAHLDLAKAGLIATTGAVLGNALQIAFGLLADRGWRKLLLVVGTLLAGAVTLAPWTRSYPGMFVLVLTTYVGSAAFHPAGAGAAASLSRRRTGLMVGLFLAGGYGGFSLSQLLFSRIYESAPLLTPALLLVPVGSALATARLVPRTAPVARARGETWRALGPKLRPIAPLFALQVFATGLNLALVFLLPDLLQARHAPAWVVQGGGHFALVAGACLSLLPAGHASDRWGPRRALLFANVAAGAVLAALLVRTTASPVDLALVAAFGAFNGINNVVAVAEGNRLIPGQASAASALLMGMPWCIAAVAPVLGGVLADPARGGTPTVALAWLGLAIPLTLATGLFVRPRRIGIVPVSAPRQLRDRAIGRR